MAKGLTILLLIRIWSIVSVKIMMMMMVEAHVWACKIRLEPVWCPRFACGLVLTFSFAHRHSSTSLSFYLENCLLHCLSFACSFQTFSMERVWSHHQHHSMLIWRGLFNSSASQSIIYGGTFWWWYYHISKGRQGHKEMFPIRLVTNYFQWTMSTMWQIFSNGGLWTVP